jgi:hypothetical protein
LRKVGIVLTVFGLLFVVGAGYVYIKVQEGSHSLAAFSAAQNVKLTYNNQGQLGTDPAEAAAIMSLLTKDWGYVTNPADFDPNDPIVNTASEYMYQMATIAYHTLHGTQTVVLDKDAEYKGQTFAAGEYQVAVDGRYFSQFDRQHPLDGPARDKAWSGTAHALIAELGVGSVTASTLQMGLGLAGLFAALGATIILTGLGIVWATRAESVKAPAFRTAPMPA